ncbi:type II secretion system protein GspL [Serratia quinivorans]|uniref:type II secretion system protein GspL n=1 Tax=Serratia quinivorans TaxID=137545 RepID=UPI0021794129|nr:type II secretion system protein GspL [Serratia quinivorans]CAI0804272.1 Type II secretory pathway, component PulL [Serratia quinivorans]CAI1717373.1 Type II secretory pathway, component PulL [Serratia quinivorans]
MTCSKPLLVLALGEAGAPILWCQGDPSESQWRHAGADTLPATLPIKASQCRVVVCVPGQSVTLQRVTFSGPSRAATPLALAYQCEDSLLEEVEQLYWVILGRQDDDYALAGYRHTDMQHWQSQLKLWGVVPDSLLPDTLCGPVNDRHFYRWRGRLLRRASPWLGYSLPSQWLLAPSDVVDAVPLSPCDVLWDRVRGEAETAVSLLQGKYKAPPRWQRNPFWRHWPSIAGAVLTLCALAIGGAHYHQQAKQANQQRDALYQSLFVGQPIPAEPVSESARYIRALQTAKSPRQFFELAAQAQRALQGIPKHRVIGLTFDADRSMLAIRLQAPELQPSTQINDEGNTLELQVNPAKQQGTLTLKETQ